MYMQQMDEQMDLSQMQQEFEEDDDLPAEEQQSDLNGEDFDSQD